MELMKEKPRRKKRKERSIADDSDESTTRTAAVENNSLVVERLVKRVENLQVVDCPVGEETQLLNDPPDKIVAVEKEGEQSEMGISAPEVAVVTPTLIHNNKAIKIVDHGVVAEELEPEPETSATENNSVSSAAEKIDDRSRLDPEEKVTAIPGCRQVQQEQLYPELDDATSTSTKLSEMEKSEIRISAPPMPVVEPLTEMQLRSFYYNAELERADDFVDEFLTATLRPMSTDEFYQLLQSYFDSCRRVEQLQLDARDMNQRWDSARRNVWLMENVTSKQQGTCGDDRPASGSYSVQRAKFQENCYEDLKQLGSKRRHLRISQLPFAEHQSKTAELQCKHHVCSALQTYRLLTGITSVSPPFLRFDSPPNSLFTSRSQIRDCITVLFNFMRQPLLLTESTFVNSCRSWLNELCGTLLRYSFVEDHLFLLSHLLRCPNGVGAWAAGYIQPFCQFNDCSAGGGGELAVDHCLAMLSICLTPIRRREEYLKSFQSPDISANGGSWTIVDADGEEELEMVSISEADLLCLLNQFSFDRLFSSWFQNLQTSGELNESSILRLFALELTFLRILFGGTRAYNGVKYKQICKQLAYEMRKSVQYVGEFWAYFKSLQTDHILLARLQLEFDRLVLYTAFYGMSSKGLGVWQFLADLPYGEVSEEYQWRLGDLLVSSANDGVSPRELGQKSVDHIRPQLADPKLLEFRLHDLDDSDALHLLTALSAMASSSNDPDLVRVLTHLLYTACFESPTTREMYHKPGRELVGSIAEKHPWLFSYLLKLVESRLDRLGGYAIELFDHLPLSHWPLSDDEDWSILRRFLAQPLSSLPNSLCQRILLACNWNVISDIDSANYSCFIPQRLHRRVAEAIAKTYQDLVVCPGQIANSGLVSGSIKKASKMASGGQSNEQQQFADFCWSLSLKLKLHSFDCGYSERIIGDGGSGNGSGNDETELLEDLLELARKSSGNPVAAYVAFQLYVRSVPDLVKFGFDLIDQLLISSLPKPAVVCVVYAMKYLALQQDRDSADSMHCQEKWLRCVDYLVHFDDTYYHYAKTWIAGNFVGENLSNLASVLAETLLSLASTRQETAYKFLHYCLQLFCRSTPSRPCWSKDRPILYLLNVLIEAGFLIDPSLIDPIQVLRFAYENTILAQYRAMKSGGGILSSLLFRGGEKSPPPLLHPTYFKEFPWLAFAAIKAEQIAFQQFYRHLASEVIRNPSHTLETCVKTCCRKYDLCFPIDRLASFMFLELFCCLESDEEHRLSPLVCQQCCLALLARIRIAEDPSVPANCLYAHYLRNGAFSGKISTMKNILQSSTNSMENRKSENAAGNQISDSQAVLFQAVYNWLSDSRLLELILPNSVYGLKLFYVLQGVLDGNETPWLDFVNFDAIRASVEKRADEWVKCRYGSESSAIGTPRQQPPPPAARPTPLHRLCERFRQGESYPCMPPPNINPSDSVIFAIDPDTLKEENDLLAIANPLLDNFYAAACDFNDMRKSILSLDELFFEQLKLVYTDVSVQVSVVLKCGRGCANPNNKIVTATTCKLLDSVQNYLDQNREAWSSTIDNVSALLSYNIPQHCVSFYSIVRQLSGFYADFSRKGDNLKSNRIKKIGIQFFYKLMVVCGRDCVLEFPPTKALFEASIGALGAAFLLSNPEEVEKLHDLLQQRPALFPILLGVFDPKCASGDAYLRMYETLSRWIKAGSMAPECLAECVKKMDVKQSVRRLNQAQIDRLNRISLDASVTCSSKQPQEKENNYSSILTLLRRDWIDSLLAGLPSQFRPSLESLLKASETGQAPLVLYDDLMQALSATVSTTAGGDPNFIIGPAVFAEIVAYLSDYFKLRKSKCKTCASTASGIYHCWEAYGEKVSRLLAFCFVHSILNPDAYPSATEGIRRSFSTLECLFQPWIGVSIKDHPPCSLSSAPVAEFFVRAFVDSICCVQNLFSASCMESTQTVVTLSLEWYAREINPHLDKLAGPILRSYHVQFMRLPWNKFHPSITVLESLRQMIDKDNASSPFATTLLVRLPWMEILASLTHAPVQSRSAMAEVVLNTMIICGSKQRNYADCKASLPELFQVMTDHFDWSFLPFGTAEKACDYVLRTYDPKCVLLAMEHEDNGSSAKVEWGVLKLISAVCCCRRSGSISSARFTEETTRKRVLYPRMSVALAVRCSRSVDIAQSEMSRFLIALITKIDNVIRMEETGEVGGRTRDLALQLAAQVGLFLNHANQQLFDECVASVRRWLEEHSDSTVPLALIRAYGHNALTVQAWVTVAEICIRSYFMRWSPNPNWSELLDWFDFKPCWRANLKSSCLERDDGSFLVFYCSCRKALERRRELAEETIILRDVIDILQSMSEKQFPEGPLVVLIGHSLELLVRQGNFGAGAASLVNLSREMAACLQNAADGKSGFLSTLGLAKRIAYSPRFQLLCTLLSNYLTQQIIDDTHIRLNPAAVVANSREHWFNKELRTQKRYSSAFSDVLDAAATFFAVTTTTTAETGGGCSSMTFEHVLNLHTKLAPMLFNERYVIDQCCTMYKQ